MFKSRLGELRRRRFCFDDENNQIADVSSYCEWNKLW